MSTELITVNGIEVPRPDELRIRIRDLTILVDHASFPVTDWRNLRQELRVLLLLAELVYTEDSHG